MLGLWAAWPLGVVATLRIAAALQSSGATSILRYDCGPSKLANKLRDDTARAWPARGAGAGRATITIATIPIMARMHYIGIPIHI